MRISLNLELKVISKDIWEFYNLGEYVLDVRSIIRRILKIYYSYKKYENTHFAKFIVLSDKAILEHYFKNYK